MAKPEWYERCEVAGTPRIEFRVWEILSPLVIEEVEGRGGMMMGVPPQPWVVVNAAGGGGGIGQLVSAHEVDDGGGSHAIVLCDPSRLHICTQKNIFYRIY
jgi:hypothetical protein